MLGSSPPGGLTLGGLGGGMILPRIDLPTRVILDPMTTSIVIYQPNHTVIVDAAVVTHVLSDHAPTSSVDPQLDSVVLDGQPWRS